MTTKTEVMLLVIVDETDRLGELPLYEAIVRRLVKAEIAGATVTAGIMGYGKTQLLHRKRLFGISDDKPVSLLVVDDQSKIEAILPEIRGLVQDGLVLMMPVTVVE